MEHGFLKTSYILPTQCIYVIPMILRTMTNYFPTQTQPTGFYNLDVFTVRYELNLLIQFRLTLAFKGLPNLLIFM
jgi:hypothetical protein